MTKIILVCPYYSYGNPNRPVSSDFNFFFYSFINLGYEVVCFHPDIVAFNEKKNIDYLLTNQVATFRPDYIFHVVFNSELDPNYELFSLLKSKFKCVTIAWNSDDHWRFEFSKSIIHNYDYMITTDIIAYKKFIDLGYSNKIIKSQWGVSKYLFQDLYLKRNLDVTFVGQNYGSRSDYINSLQKEEIRVEVKGLGWNNFGIYDSHFLSKILNRLHLNMFFPKEVSYLELISLINQSKISLNFSKSYKKNAPNQIKARVFEITAGGAMLLTENADDLNDYFEIGTEIDIFSSKEELVEKVKYYLLHDKIRVNMAKKGQQKALNTHSMENRIFEIMQFIERGKHN